MTRSEESATDLAQTDSDKEEQLYTWYNDFDKYSTGLPLGQAELSR